MRKIFLSFVGLHLALIILFSFITGFSGTTPLYNALLSGVMGPWVVLVSAFLLGWGKVFFLSVGALIVLPISIWYLLRSYPWWAGIFFGVWSIFIFFYIIWIASVPLQVDFGR